MLLIEFEENITDGKNILKYRNIEEDFWYYLYIVSIVSFILPIYIFLNVLLKILDLNTTTSKILFFIYVLINIWGFINFANINCINDNFTEIIYIYQIVQSILHLIFLFFFIIKKIYNNYYEV